MRSHMNNIKVTHLSREISIAQHKEFEGGVSETTTTQEVAIMPNGGQDTTGDWVIIKYTNNLNSLIKALENIRTIIETEQGLMSNPPKVWDAYEIVTTYDSSPDLTLGDLSRRSGWSVGDLLKLLTSSVGIGVEPYEGDTND